MRRPAPSPAVPPKSNSTSWPSARSASLEPDPMPLVLTEEETMLADSAKRFFAGFAPIGAFRALRDSGAPQRYAPALWTEMAAMGFAGMLVPASEGGTGFGYTGAGLVAEQSGHVLAASPLLSTALAAEILSRDGNADQKTLLGSIADG